MTGALSEELLYLFLVHGHLVVGYKYLYGSGESAAVNSATKEKPDKPGLPSTEAIYLAVRDISSPGRNSAMAEAMATRDNTTRTKEIALLALKNGCLMKLFITHALPESIRRILSHIAVFLQRQ